LPQITSIQGENMQFKNSIVVIKINNNLQSPHATQIEKTKQVDSDQGSKLTRFRGFIKDLSAISTLVVSLIAISHEIFEFVRKFF